MQYLVTAFKKFIFCFKIAADFKTFVKLLWFTKKYKWNKSRGNSIKAVSYNLLLNKKIQTVYLRTYSGDISIFYEIFFKEVYKTEDKCTSSIIMDIGANIGLATIYFLAKNPHATIISVEPDPANAFLFRKNLLNEITLGRVLFFETAVSDRCGKMYLSQPLKKYNPKLLQQAAVNAIDVEVLSIHSLMDLCKVSEIKILKIDVEGAEETIFSNKDEWLAKVKTILVEIHSENSKRNILEILRQQNFILQSSANSIYHFSK